LAPVGDLADMNKNQQRRLADRVMCANAQGLRLFRGCAAAYGELAVGEALVSFLDDQRRAHPGGAGPGGASPLHDHNRDA
jgi:hypothetical protein